MAMDIVKSVAFPILQCAAGPVWSHIGFLIFYKSNLDKLNTQLQTLREVKQSLQQRVDAAKIIGEEVFENVQNCLMKAGDAIAEANDSEDNEEHARVGCLNGPFPNLWTMHQQSKKATERAKEISEIITQVNEAIKMDTISWLPLLPMAFPPSARGYEALNSRTSILVEIMQKLKDDNLYMIGLYGMGGVGKSTLIEEVTWQAEGNGSYGVVIKAIVTTSPKVEEIQDQLADGLGLKFNEKSVQGRARRLWDRIRKENKVLIIMDDIWEKINLMEVGVPFCDEHKGCKLLLTSRFLNVLKNDMGTQENFRLETLFEEESWNLFEKTAGDVVKDNCIQPIASKVAGACKGLPLLIVTVAKALKDQNLYAWKDAHRQLTKNDHEELASVVNEAIELSYKYLATDQHKSLFLLIGSVGQRSFHVEDLLICGWGLGLFKNVETLADARNKLYKLIDDLRASSLILEGEREWAGMHDVVHEGAAMIASRLQPYIILNWCNMSALPEHLDSVELELLLLSSEDNSLKVPDHFFSEVINMKVLDLGEMMCAPSLPPSLGLLKNLRALYLCQCILEDITKVSELTSLEILSLEDSEIQELPVEIRQLTRLRMLNLNNCKELRRIPANLISSLESLEELYMGNCYIQWAVEGSEQRNNACLSELGHLNHLKLLHVQIHDISNIPRDLLIFGNLEKYKILIGDGWKWTWGYFGYSETFRILKLNLSSSTITHFDHQLTMLFNEVEDLSLAEVKGATNVLPKLSGGGFAQLKHLLIQNSVEILYIIDSTKWIYPHVPFLNLESLVIQNLINLEQICCGPHRSHIFAKLQVIKVQGCERLKNLLSFSMAIRNLPQLHELEISECKFMSSVVEDTQEECEGNTKINFPKIQLIKLENLPNLVSFSAKQRTINLQSESNFARCKDNLSNPLALFHDKITMPNLETMTLSSLDIVKLWDHISVPSCIQNLTTLTIDSCGGLKYLCSSLVGMALIKLRYLKITNCKMMENIFILDREFGNVQSTLKPFTQEEVEFPNIETLVVSKMDNLKSIYHDEVATNPFPKLVKMEILSCQKLLSVFPSHVLKHLNNLESLVVSDCASLEVVFETQGLYNVSMELLQLQMLDIRSCGVIKSIVAKHETVDEDPRFVFPQLASLIFWDLSELKSFFPRIHALDCPSLKRLHVYHCNKLKKFESKSQNFQEVVQFHGQPLFSSAKVIPKIHELSLDSNDVTSICNGEYCADDLFAVKALSLQCFHDESDKFPVDFLQRFPNIEKLEVGCSRFKEIFSSENARAIKKLKTLLLNGLCDLEHLCKEKYEMPPILQTIELLEVICCPELKIAVPSSSSELFRNLDRLLVNVCSGLLNIIASSAARSFHKLRYLGIFDCERVEEIVASADDSDGGEIAFVKLEQLELVNLPMVTSFCKEKFSFKFPLLQILFVIECPKMETFSHGVLSAPKLRKVQVSPDALDEWRWEGELNTTIRKVFDEEESGSLLGNIFNEP